jgi:uncharacterized delta-60 repeat protein
MKIKILAILIIFLFSTYYSAAQISTQWIARFNGSSNNNDGATCITIDNQGNTYVGGYSISSANQEDYLTIKYNAAGEEVWVARYNGTANGKDIISAIALDNAGNTYITGSSEAKNNGFDYVTIKYNPKGEEEWVARYNGGDNNNDGANAIALDREGNVFVTGYSTNKETSIDIVTIKYTSSGDVAWTSKFNNPRNTVDYGTCLALDDMGNVYVGGYSESESSGLDYTILKYTLSGSLSWYKSYNGSGGRDDQVKAIAVDQNGNLYVTGSSYGISTSQDIVTLKYNPHGDLLWQAKYNGPGNNIDAPGAMLVDKNNNIYITGSSVGNGTNFDYVTLKYNPDGVELWTSRYNDQGNSGDEATSLALDSLGSIYVTGSVWNGTDNDYATIKYNPLGNELWVAKYNGPGNSLDKATGIAVDSKGNIYVTGYGIGTATQNDFATIKYLQLPPESAPNLLSPAYGSSGISQNPTLEWNPLKNADFFRLQIAGNKSFGDMILDTNIYISNEQYKVPDGRLSNNTQYFWRLGATNAAGSGPWSPIWTFSVLNAPDSPELLSPQNGAAGQSLTPTLSWQKVSTAESFHLQIAKDYRFAEIVHDADNLTTNEITLPGGLLSNNSVYFWRVNATNVGGTVPWSNVWSLGTGYVNPPQVPVLINLPNGALGQSLTPTLSWNDVPSVSSYRIQVASDLNFTSIAIDDGNLFVSHYTIPAGKLSNNKTYYWRVLATNLGGVGPFSLIWTFSTMVSGLAKIGTSIPKELKLYDNSPEPFSSTTTIRFDIPANYINTRVSVIVYDLSGKEVTKIIDENVKSGSWIVNWDGSNYPRGYYLFQLHAEGFVQTKRMLLVK